MDRKRPTPLRRFFLRVFPLLLLPLSAVLVLDSLVYAMPTNNPVTGESRPCTTALGFPELVRWAERISPLGAIAAVVMARRKRKAAEEA